ncbi:MAG: InlB B-repeat-containing protein, partial [Clostridia bacterium]|nr:InlB B-repeat-containing protein [Clostridia bacterium]
TDIGDGLLITTVTGQVGEEIVLPTDPQKDGYTFGGWYLDYACTMPFVVTTYSKDLTLYAKWVKN